MSDNVSGSYMAASNGRNVAQSTAEMQEWMKTFEAGDMAAVPPFIEPITVGDGPKPLPATKPQRRATDDSMGRLPVEKPSAGGTVMRNLAEIPGQAIGGVHDAIMNATSWAIDPLANWLNDNVADLRYDPKTAPVIHDPQTGTGGIVREVSKFLTGFIPAIKGLKTAGMTGAASTSVAAGAISDFAVRSGNEAKLSDLWNKMELPKNVLTDYLSSKPNDSEIEGRFKAAVEGTGLGAMTEGVFLAAKALKAARGVRQVQTDEISYLRGKYGEVTDENIVNTGLGDSSKAIVSVEKRAPKPESKQPVEVPNLDPRALIRGASRQHVVNVKVYHGTGNPELSTLNDLTVSQDFGFHVTVDKKTAQNIADERSMGRGGLVIEGTIAPKSSLRLPDLGEWDPDELARTLVGKGVGDDSLIAAVKSAKDDTTAYAFIKDALRAKGYDSVVYDNVIEGGGKSYIILDKSIVLDHSKLKELAIKPEDFDVYVNFARFDEPDSVKFAIGKMAEASKGTIDEATRGRITQEETVMLAIELGMDGADLLARRKGQGFNAEEAVAARQLWAASGEKLVELAKKAAGKEATPLDHFAFRKMMATHSAIQAEVIGARTETARALASWAIPVKGGVERARLVDQVLASTGGVETSQEMAKRLAILAESGADPATIGKFAFKGYGSATTDAIKELWVNGLLSSPKTHVVNVFSNTVTAFQSIYERQAAGLINEAAGGGAQGVQMGEAIAMAYGLIGGVKDSFRLAAQYLKTGKSEFTFNKVDILKPEAISSEAFNISQQTGMGRFVDFIGKVVGSPMHALGAEDEFFKSIGYRMEVRAQALRTASAEGHQGDALIKRIAELTNNPPEAIRINSADAAMYNTYTNEMGAFGRAVMQLRNIDHPLNPAVFVMPFIRTPVNIARYAFERTPFAPLVSQWRADIAAGGARADLALARMSTGTAIMLTAMDLADQGIISGGGPKTGDKGAGDALTRQGWQPYSVQVGDRWYSYNRVDPFGMTIGFAASIAEAVKKGEIDENDIDEWQEVTAMAIAAVSQVAISKTYLEGFSKFVETLSDPKRYSEKYVNDLFASFLPATSLNSAVKNMVDPIQREAGSPMEAVQAKIAGLSENLPPRRNLWGEPITTESGLGRVYDAVTPIASKAIVDSPIDKEIVRLEDGPSKIMKKTTFDGVQANFKQWPKAYDDYVRLAGNDLKHPAWGMGAKDYLNAVAAGNHPMSATYNIMSDESRRAFIKNTIENYRKLAQQQVLNDPKHASFAKEIAYLKTNKFENRMPVMGEMK